MIVLNTTTKSLEIDLDGAVAATQLPFTTSYIDVTTTTYVSASNDGTTNSTTAVSIVAAPAASTQRQVKLISVYNADSAAAVVSISLNNNATLRTLIKLTLPALYTLQYTDGEGWRVLDASGNSLTSSRTNMLLDGSVHTDTVAQTVSRGSLVYGNSTPKWDELIVGAANRLLRTDGTDISWAQAAIATDISGLGAGVAAFLATPSSANLLTAVTDETGTGAVVFGTAPVFTTSISTPSIITASGALSVTPAAGSNLNVTLGTTGDFTVNTNQFYVDTSTGRIGVGTASPGVLVDVLAPSGGAIPMKLRTAGNDYLRYQVVNLGATLSVGIDQSPAILWTGSTAYSGFVVTESATDLQLGANNAISVTLRNGGNVGVGETSPDTRLHVTSADNSTNTTLEITALQAAITGADKWVSFTSLTGEEANVVGTGVLGVVAYNTFTGSHKTIVEGVEPAMMLLLEMTGVRMSSTDFTSRGQTSIRIIPGVDGAPNTEERTYAGPAPKEFLPRTRVCTTKGSKACFGVYAGKDGSTMAMALALGTGWMMVANKGQNLRPGDYLISSDVAGHAERQVDDIKRASTVASVSEDVVWVPLEVTRRVAVRYLMG